MAFGRLREPLLEQTKNYILATRIGDSPPNEYAQWEVNEGAEAPFSFARKLRAASSIRRAKDELKLKSVKVGFEGWAWKR